jgi:GTP cyclohydrolase II
MLTAHRPRRCVNEDALLPPDPRGGLVPSGRGDDACPCLLLVEGPVGSDLPGTPASSGNLLQAEADHVTRSNGTFKVYVADHDSGEHVVLVRGDVRDREGVLCRISSACVMSTALGSAECDCKDQLSAAMDLIARDECGIVIYLVDQEGRGHGLTWKVRALRNKNWGMDTFAAVETLGLAPDVRDYSVVPAILDELGVGSVVLLTNNPEKRRRIEAAGVRIKEARALEACPPPHAWRHMEAKRVRGHALSNSYVDADTAELPVLGQWMPAVAAPLVDHNQDGSASTLSQ